MAVGDKPDQQELEAQMQVAIDAVRAAVLRLLREGEVHPQVIVLAVARVAGELGASAALAGGQDVEKLLGELADVVQQAGREQLELLRAELEALPVAGNA
jgi:hypothetical protein